MYRSPSASELSKFNSKKILPLLPSVSLFRSKFLVVGDFNLPSIDWTLNTTQHSDESFENQFL